MQDERSLKIITEGPLRAEVASPISFYMHVENAPFQDVVIIDPNGVAYDIKAPVEGTGEVVVTCSHPGEFSIGVKFIDEIETRDTITMVIEEESTTPANSESDTDTIISTEEATGEVNASAQEQVSTPSTINSEEKTEEVVKETKVDPDTAELLERLEMYCSAMGPKIIVSESDVIIHQIGLFKIFTMVLNKTGVEFNKNISTLIKFIREHRQGAFNEKYIARGMSQIKLNANDRLLFARLITLFSISADVDNKTLVGKRFDFRYIANLINNDSTMQRLNGYYNPSRE